MIHTRLAVVPFAAGSLFAILTMAGSWTMADDLETIRTRVVEPLLVAPDARVVRNLLGSQQPDGSWTDIDYSSKTRSGWNVPTHLSRVVILAQAYRTSPGDQPRLAALEAAKRGLDYWLRADPQNPNWWWNRIGVPRTVLPVMLLLEDQLTASQRDQGLKILRRAGIGMTGQNLVWVTEITAGYGLLTRDKSLVSKAYRRIAEEIRISDGEGIQADFSFHQHGPCLYNHGYGAGFIVDCSRIAAQVAGTELAFPAEKIDLLSHLILDGTQWMTRCDASDFGAEGREITRRGQSLNHLVEAVNNMLQLRTGREAEFRELARRAAGQEAPPLVGNRHFWRADFMTHHRPGYYASARCYSRRLANTDGPANSEGLLSHHLADGCFVLIQHGREYQDLFPVWDWQRIPGTTIERVEQLSGNPRRKGITDFVGGVSDGQFGAAACDFARDQLVARKSWFFFDREIVCLGAGIRSDSDLRVITTVNQCRLKGDVLLANSDGLQTLGHGQHQADRVEYVWHDNVAYIFPEPQSLSIQNERVTGSWHRASHRYPDTEVHDRIFAIWLSHGHRPRDADYAYVVVPAMASSQIADYCREPGYRILANTSQIQAVEQSDLKLLAAAFYEAGELRVGSELLIRVDMPCLLLARHNGSRVILTASNPCNTAARLTVDLVFPSAPSQNRRVPISLPDGLRAGSSVTVR